MPMLVSFPSSDGDILIEVERPDDGRPVTRGGGEILHKASLSFEAAWARINPIATQIIQKLGDAIEGTEQVQVRFGVKFSADAGIFIASTGTEANFAIEITWKKPHPST